MPTLRERWMAHWFEPASPSGLGASRMIFFGLLLFLYSFVFPFSQDLSLWADVSPVFWRPRTLFEHLHLGVLSASWLRAAEVIWKVSLLTAALGIATRLSTGVAFFLGVYLLGLPHNFGKTYHYDAMVVLALAILALSRAGDAWSLDSLVRAARRGRVEKPKPSGEYTWPIRAIWMVMSLVFFAAGVAKLRASGLAWLAPDNFSIILIQQHYRISDTDPLTRWGLLIAQSRVLARAMAAFSLAVELGFPLAMFSKVARWVFVPGAVLMIAGIRLLMGPSFETFLVCMLFWVPWERVGAFLSSRVEGRHTHALLFDGACGLCGGTAAVVKRLDLFNRVALFDAANGWPEVARRFPGLTQQACLDEMHVVDARGRVAKGFDAYRALARLLPLAWPLAPALYVPPVPAVGRAIYGWVAARRRRAACAMPAKRGRLAGKTAHGTF